MLCGVVCLAMGWEHAAWGQVDYATPFTFTTIAGNAGYGTADGLGSAARFDGLQGVAVDGAGVWYITDSDNGTVRALTPSVSAGKTNWLVSTIAGLAGSPGSADGAGSAARFSGPNGIAVDSGGSLYVADTANHTIRRLSPSVSAGQTQWLVTTIAGLAGNSGSTDGTNGAARFYRPNGIAVDSAGSLYVADNGNATIRKLAPSLAVGQTNWVVSTIAGLAGSYGSADGTGSAARFFNPSGLAVDTAGSLYASDYGSSTIRKLTPSLAAGQTNWVVSTIAGSVGGYGSADGTGSAAQFFDAYGITADSAGNLYVADSGNNTLRKITPSVSAGQTNWVVSTIAGSAGNAGSDDGTGAAALFNYPNGIAVNGAGALCVADTFNNTVREATPSVSGGYTNWVVSTIAGLAGGSGSADGSGTAAGFFKPFGLAVDSAGNVYVADSWNDTIRQITPNVSAGQTNWVVTTLAGLAENDGSEDGTGSAALFSNPLGLAADKAGHLYVADYGNATIRQLMPSVLAGRTNWVVTTIAGSPGNTGSMDGTGSAARFAGPVGIAADRAGNLYVADADNCTIRQLTPSVSAGQTNWTVTTIAGSPGIAGSDDGTGSSALFNYPGGIAVDETGNLFVADSFNNAIRGITPTVSAGHTNWVVTTIAGTTLKAGSADGTGGVAQFNTPYGIAVDQGGNLYVADSSNNTIRKLRPGAGAGQTQWLVTTLAGLAGKCGSADGTGSGARFDSPSGIAVGSMGSLYVADCDNNTVRMGFSPPLIVLSAPTITAGQAQISFSLLSGSTASFQLLNASRASGPWTTNTTAALATNRPGASYTFTVRLPPDSAQFYRVQCP